MKQLANYIKIVPFHQYVSFNGTDITANVEVLILYSNTPIQFNEDPDNKNGNPYYKQSFQLVTDKLSANIRNMYPAKIPVVVLLYTDDQQPHILGNENSKLRLTIQPTPNEDILSFSREAEDTLF